MKEFLFRSLHNMTLRQRLAHTLVTFGIPVFILEILSIERPDEGLVMGILIALFSGVVAGIVFALIEHAFFTVVKKSKHPEH